MTTKQCRRFDALAQTRLGIPGLVLMENAGRNTTEAIQRLLAREMAQPAHRVRAVILCGSGNNAGDGYAIARLLSNRGMQVNVIALKPIDELTGDALTQAKIAAAMDLPIDVHVDGLVPELSISFSQPVVIVDALLGTGFHGELREPYARLIDWCNRMRQSGAKVVAVDVPSGLHADTGKPAQTAIRADLTVTFVAAKPGLIMHDALEHVGRLEVADIGAPASLIQQVLDEGA